MPAWTTPELVAAALGPSAAPPPGDEWLQVCVDAANAAAYRKRHAAGYIDDPGDTAPAPDGAVKLGTTYWARDMWRSRQTTDSPTSYDEIAGFIPTGSWPEIKKLLGIGRAAVDSYPEVTPYMVRRRLHRLARARGLFR